MAIGPEIAQVTVAIVQEQEIVQETARAIGLEIVPATAREIVAVPEIAPATVAEIVRARPIAPRAAVIAQAPRAQVQRVAVIVPRRPTVAVPGRPIVRPLAAAIAAAR